MLTNLSFLTTNLFYLCENKKNEILDCKNKLPCTPKPPYIFFQDLTCIVGSTRYIYSHIEYCCKANKTHKEKQQKHILEHI